MDPYVCSSIIYNSQIMEAVQVSINRWMDKEVGTYTMEYYSAIKKKESNHAIFNDMDGAREYSARRKKSKKDKYHVISLICTI